MTEDLTDSWLKAEMEPNTFGPALLITRTKRGEDGVVGVSWPVDVCNFLIGQGVHQVLWVVSWGIDGVYRDEQWAPTGSVESVL